MDSICVLIPTKDRRHLLERSLQSVFDQTSVPDEIIVVNDGSTDDTRDFLDRLLPQYANLRVIHRNVNGGVNRARHDGIALAQSRWIACLDDDDEFFPNAVAIMRSKIPEVPDGYAVIFFNSVIKTNLGDRSGGFQFRGESFYDLNYEEMMTKHRLRGDCKPVFRKSVFDEGYSFPLTVNGLESYLFYLLARDGKGIRCYPQVTTHVYFDDSNVHLSHTGPRKNPWSLLKIHAKQIPEHFRFYASHPILFYKKIKEMIKLSVRSIDVLISSEQK